MSVGRKVRVNPVLAVLAVMGLTNSADASGVSPLPNRSLGSCLDQDRRPVDLRRVMFLENRELERDTPYGSIRIILSRQTITIRTIRRHGEETWRPIDVGVLVGRDGATADVEVRLGLHEDQIVAYWRETFRHRMYRQGLFRFQDQELVPVCNGNGGEDIFE